MSEDLKKLYNSIVKFVQNNKFIIFITLASFLFKLDYVFHNTNYSRYIVSDMSVYMSRAEQRFNGDLFNVWQWTGWSTYFSFYLTAFFKILYFFGLYDKKLEMIILLNVLYSSLSVIFVYLIAKKIISDKRFFCITTVFYAFSFQIYYLNAFVLSENIAIPLLILSTYLTLFHSDRKSYMFISGLLMGFVVSFRPALSLIFIPSVVYVILNRKISLQSFTRAFLFTLGFVSITFMACVENCYISKGGLKGLSSLGGIHFYFEQCKIPLVHSSANGAEIEMGPEVFSSLYKNDPKKLEAKLYTNRPIYDQEYFYGLARECIKKNPNVWIENFFFLKYLFIGATFPYFSDASWVIPLDGLSKKVITFMSIASLALIFLLKKNNVITKEILFLISVPLFMAITSYFFLPGQRLLLPAYYAIYILFFYLISKTNYYKNPFVVAGTFIYLFV